MKKNVFPDVVSVLVACALPIEAKPIITHFGLVFFRRSHGFTLYLQKPAHDQDPYTLIGLLVTGAGKVNMAAGLMWANAYIQSQAFLNVGIAGHGSADIGDVFLIDKVIDVDSKEVFYPGIHFSWKAPCCRLNTLSSPSKDYLNETAFDMEGSAFFSIASRLVTIEKIQLLKVISDVPKNPFENVSSDQVQTLIHDCLKNLENLIESIQSLVIPDSTDVDLVLTQMQSKWHITVSNQQKIKEKLQTISVLREHTERLPPAWREHDNVKSYLHDCEEWLIQLRPKLK